MEGDARVVKCLRARYRARPIGVKEVARLFPNDVDLPLKQVRSPAAIAVLSSAHQVVRILSPSSSIEELTDSIWVCLALGMPEPQSVAQLMGGCLRQACIGPACRRRIAFGRSQSHNDRARVEPCNPLEPVPNKIEQVDVVGVQMSLVLRHQSFQKHLPSNVVVACGVLAINLVRFRSSFGAHRHVFL